MPPLTSDVKNGHYYVSILNGSRKCLALGPFTNNHIAALSQVEQVNDYVSEHYPGGWFYAYGTCRIVTNNPPAGILNKQLNYPALPPFELAIGLDA